MRRLIITAVVVTAAVMAVSFLTRPTPEQLAAQQAADVDKQEQAERERVEAEHREMAVEAPLVEAVGVDVDATPGAEESIARIEIDVAGAREVKTEGVRGGYEAHLSTKGGQLTRFELTGYTDNDRRDVDGNAPNVDLAAARYRGAGAFSFRSRGGDVPLAPDADFVRVDDTDGAPTFERTTAQGVNLRRVWRFDPLAFQIQHELHLENRSSQTRKLDLDLELIGEERDGERDQGGFFGAYSDKLAAVCKTTEGREKHDSSGVEEPERHAGQVSYAAIDRHFFLGTVVVTSGATEGCTVEGWKAPGVPGPTGKIGPERFGLVTKVHYAPITLLPGESQTLSHEAFFGPKQLGLLQAAGHKLDENVDFGWFGILSRPFLWLLVKINDYTGNFGWSIILLTLLIKLLTFPLTQKSYVNMQQMKTLQPELKALQKKYAGDKAKQGQAQMDLYKERGINPMSGCFPMLVQMPIWFALYRTLWNSVELYQQPFIAWVTDLSQPDQFPLFGGFPSLPILVGALMFVSTAMQPTPQDQPQMKYIMWGMPVFFSLLMLQMPSGLSVYMITNSMLTMAQQFYIRRKYPAPDAATVVEVVAETPTKKRASPAPSSEKGSQSRKKKNKKKR